MPLKVTVGDPEIVEVAEVKEEPKTHPMSGARDHFSSRVLFEGDSMTYRLPLGDQVSDLTVGKWELYHMRCTRFPFVTGDYAFIIAKLTGKQLERARKMMNLLASVPGSVWVAPNHTATTLFTKCDHRVKVKLRDMILQSDELRLDVQQMIVED